MSACWFPIYISLFVSRCLSYSPQGQYWAGTPAEPLLRTTATTNMAAANFVVITNGEGCALTGTADIDQ